METALVEKKRRLAALAVRAQSAGDDAAVLAWWRELAGMVLALAARARGIQFKVAGRWFVAVPPDSSCHGLARAYSVVCGAPMMKSGRATLAEMSELRSEGDPVVDATRLLARAALAMENGRPVSAGQVTEDLLECVSSIAAEFESSSPRPPPQLADGDPGVEMASWVIGDEPSIPRPGEEVGDALAHCEELAHQRLGPGA
ncbi:hypothetical protein ACLESD_01525 [Pyxidicoccus sp. 3LFB2]